MFYSRCRSADITLDVSFDRSRDTDVKLCLWKNISDRLNSWNPSHSSANRDANGRIETFNFSRKKLKRYARWSLCTLMCASGLNFAVEIMSHKYYLNFFIPSRVFECILRVVRLIKFFLQRQNATVSRHDACIFGVLRDLKTFAANNASEITHLCITEYACLESLSVS